MRYDYHCTVCKSNFEKIVPVDDRDLVMCCGKVAQRTTVYAFNTDVDRAYQFVLHGLGNKPVQIISKTHYRRLLKQHGRVDASPAECMKVKPKDHKYRIRKQAQRITEKLAQDGLVKPARDFLIANLKKGAERAKKQKKQNA